MIPSSPPQKNPKTSSLPKGRGSFVTKLSEIMKIFPDIIHWTEDGEKIKINDVRKMEETVLPTYYRHNNIHSFVRQLNMYYFSKLQTPNKNEMLFRNKSFKKGNECNLSYIKRRNKGRDQLIHKIHDKFSETISRIQENRSLPNQAKEMIVLSIEYQQIAVKNLERIKNNIAALSNQMKNTRNKELKETIEKLQTIYAQKIGQLIEGGKSLDQFIKTKLCQDIEISSFTYRIDLPKIDSSANSIFKFFSPQVEREQAESDQISFGVDSEENDEQNNQDHLHPINNDQ